MSEAKELLFDICKMLSKSVHDINNSLFVIVGQLSILEHLLNKEEQDIDKINKTMSKMRKGGDQVNIKMGLLRDFYRVGLDDPNFANWASLNTCVEYLFEVQEDRKVSFTIDGEPSFQKTSSEGFFILYHLAKATEGEQASITIREENTAIFFSSPNFQQGMSIKKLDAIDQKTFKLEL